MFRTPAEPNPAPAAVILPVRSRWVRRKISERAFLNHTHTSRDRLFAVCVPPVGVDVADFDERAARVGDVGKVRGVRRQPQRG